MKAKMIRVQENLNIIDHMSKIQVKNEDLLREKDHLLIIIELIQDSIENKRFSQLLAELKFNFEESRMRKIKEDSIHLDSIDRGIIDKKISIIINELKKLISSLCNGEEVMERGSHNSSRLFLKPDYQQDINPKKTLRKNYIVPLKTFESVESENEYYIELRNRMEALKSEEN